MIIRLRTIPAILISFAFLVCSAAASGQTAGITLPAGTKVATLKNSEQEVVNLKPAEQVAFVFVYGIKDLESTCGSTFFGGPGRPCTMSELVSGLKTENGQIIGLSRNPANDKNYQYTLTIIGKHCIVTAVPKVAGLGAFAWIGSAGGIGGDHVYYAPGGADLTKANTFSEMGYEGSGFKR